MEVPDGTEEVWLLPGRNTAFYSPPDPAAQQRGNLHASAAHWCALSASAGSLQMHVYTSPHASLCKAAVQQPALHSDASISATGVTLM